MTTPFFDEQDERIDRLTYYQPEENLNVLWGELRALLAVPSVSSYALWQLCAYVSALDHAHYVERWRPYLAGHVVKLPPYVLKLEMDRWLAGRLCPVGVPVVWRYEACERISERKTCGCGGKA